MWAAFAVLLVIVGLLIGQRFSPAVGDLGSSQFRLWFWEHRGLDLVAQVGLIFAGALGIAALLPRGDEEVE
jgi:hypothetical protein